jgi:hypothetical protein
VCRKFIKGYLVCCPLPGTRHRAYHSIVQLYVRGSTSALLQLVMIVPPISFPSPVSSPVACPSSHRSKSAVRQPGQGDNVPGTSAHRQWRNQPGRDRKVPAEYFDIQPLDINWLLSGTVPYKFSRYI